MPAGLPFDLPVVLVLRYRPAEDRIEARWPALDLLATFSSWPVALAQVARIHEFLALGDVPIRVRAPLKNALK